MVKHAILAAKGAVNNSIFDLNGVANRDGCLYPYYLLKQKFQDKGFNLVTPDLFDGGGCSFELHLDARDRMDPEVPAYLLMLENPLVHPANANLAALKQYKLVFTWNDDLVNGRNFIKIGLPNTVRSIVPDGYRDRPHLCCMIANNKSLLKADSRDLYRERVKTLKWFELNAPGQLVLYGQDWDMPPLLTGLIGPIQRRLFRIIRRYYRFKGFNSYRGQIPAKRDALLQARFCICYENVRDLPGYITEKIFDCFLSGCVPIYWGASNINEHVPPECFIDRRNFASHGELLSFIQGMPEHEFIRYQTAIASFLDSPRVQLFTDECFADIIVSHIVSNLDIHA